MATIPEKIRVCKGPGQFWRYFCLVCARLHDNLPGIDGVFVGPSDLSIALSGGARLDPHGPEVDTALTHVVARATAHGKFASAFCFSGLQARGLKQRGYLLTSVATDGLLLKSAAKAELAALAGG